MPTVLTKLSHALPPDELEALAAMEASGGLQDAMALDAVGRVGSRDGLYREPSAAIAAPAIDRLIALRLVVLGDTVVRRPAATGFAKRRCCRRSVRGRSRTARSSTSCRCCAEPSDAGGCDRKRHRSGHVDAKRMQAGSGDVFPMSENPGERRLGVKLRR